MIRLLGVLVGSALAAVALVVFVGIPEFTTASSVAEESVMTLPIRPDVVAESEPIPAPPAAETIEMSEQVPAEVTETAGGESAESIVHGPEAEPFEPQPIETMQQWYAFWSPFRSEIAATGFVDQLQRVTGLDYRVVKIKPGVYEVAFAYSDNDEIVLNLSQISAATGLNLPEN